MRARAVLLCFPCCVDGLGHTVGCTVAAMGQALHAAWKRERQHCPFRERASGGRNTEFQSRENGGGRSAIRECEVACACCLRLLVVGWWLLRALA